MRFVAILALIVGISACDGAPSASLPLPIAIPQPSASPDASLASFVPLPGGLDKPAS